jgi:hypothetical protein
VQVDSENEAINGIDQLCPSPHSLLFCTYDDLVGIWDSRSKDFCSTKFVFKGSNPQDIKCNKMRNTEFAVCDDRQTIYVSCLE